MNDRCKRYIHGDLYITKQMLDFVVIREVLAQFVFGKPHVLLSVLGLEFAR